MKHGANGVKPKSYSEVLKEKQSATAPVVSTETMAAALIQQAAPCVSSTQSVARDGGSNSLVTMVTAVVKAVCPNPTVHQILDAFVEAVDSFYRNSGPNALLEAISIFNGRIKNI